ncbi:hypothetical protein G9A89_019046 [Geosiphon pyriformis]|nr:hypothetical protein G9A89_019046 [Geosiphon pyriformis]
MLGLPAAAGLRGLIPVWSTSSLGPSWRLNVRRFASKIYQFVPPPRGVITDHKIFLQRCGRGCGELADKFQSWEHLFIVTSEQMRDELAIPTRQRKWILGWRHHYVRGIDPKNIPIRTKKKKKK